MVAVGVEPDAVAASAVVDNCDQLVVDCKLDRGSVVDADRTCDSEGRTHPAASTPNLTSCAFPSDCLGYLVWLAGNAEQEELADEEGSVCGAEAVRKDWNVDGPERAGGDWNEDENGAPVEDAVATPVDTGGRLDDTNGSVVDSKFQQVSNYDVRLGCC